MRIFSFDSPDEWAKDMTTEEAISILTKHAFSDGKAGSPRAHMAKACQMGIAALQNFKIDGSKVTICPKCRHVDYSEAHTTVCSNCGSKII